MKKLLLTGGTGFIGTHCLNLLKEEPYEIYLITRGECNLTSSKNLHVLNIDLFDFKNVEHYIEKIRPTVLMHLAWKMETGLNLESEENEKWLNLSKWLVRTFYEHGGKRVLIAGSCFEYDLSKRDLVVEESQLRPYSSYGKSKVELFKYVQSFSEKNDLSFVWPRIFFAFGQGQKQTSLVPHVVLSLINGLEVHTTDGKQEYDYLFVKDIARALVLLLASKHIGPVNVSSGIGITLEYLILTTAEYFDKTEDIRFGVKERPINSPSFIVGDNKLLKGITSWKQEYGIEKGIKEYIEDYRKN